MRWANLSIKLILVTMSFLGTVACSTFDGINFVHRSGSEQDQGDLMGTGRNGQASPAPLPQLDPTPLQLIEFKSQKKSAKKMGQKSRVKILQGFLTRPPIFEDEKLASQFNRCGEIKIIKIEKKNQGVVAEVEQQGKKFKITGLNRKFLSLDSKKKVVLFDRYLSKSLSWKNGGRSIASDQNKVCLGQTFKGMPTSDFQFIYGDPEMRRPLKVENVQFDVWTYRSPIDKSERHYYFEANVLKNWTVN